MNDVSLLSISLTVLGSASPLLTFMRLFQLKEWRLDRLREHLRHEGWMILVGTVRPIILLAYAIAVIFFSTIAGTATFIIFWLALFAGISASQLIAGKQPLPVWTTKAILLLSLAGVLTLILSIGLLQFPHNLPLVPLLQPVVVMISWAIFLPIDRTMKKRVMNIAMMKRSTMKDIVVIGIAGSVGKTTTKELIAAALSDLQPAVTPSHVNTEMGVANWLQGLKGSPRVLIIEMGAYAKGEIALLCKIAQPTIGVMTALGSDHLGLFGSEENIVEANTELINALPKDGHLFLDGSNEQTRKLETNSPCKTTIVEPPSDIHETPSGLSYKIPAFASGLQTGRQDITYDIPLHGRHNVANAALAIAVARHLGIDDKRIQELLRSHAPLPGTFNVRSESDILILDDTYNISPLSLRAALDWSATQSGKPRTLLTSGLLELGKDEGKILQELGSYAKDKVDRVIFTTESGRTAFERGYGKLVELLSINTDRAPSNSTLLCVGRMQQATINKLLPKSQTVNQ